MKQLEFKQQSYRLNQQEVGIEAAANQEVSSTRKVSIRTWGYNWHSNFYNQLQSDGRTHLKLRQGPGTLGPDMDPRRSSLESPPIH